MSKTASGKEVVRILKKHFGFFFVSQKGSYAKLQKQTDNGKVITIVPMHHELAYGTLRGALELAKIDFEEFKKFL